MTNKALLEKVLEKLENIEKRLAALEQRPVYVPVPHLPWPQPEPYQPSWPVIGPIWCGDALNIL